MKKTYSPAVKTRGRRKNKRGVKETGKRFKKTRAKKTRKNAVRVKERGKKETIKKTKKGKGPLPRVFVGVPNFDKLVDGGLEKNSTNLLVGGSGSGKTIFATQFLVEGMKKGEKCLYITFEEKKEQFYENMKDFGWDLADYEKKGLFTFLEYAPLKVRTMLEEGGGSIESIILQKKITRIVIDSITSFALLFEDELAKREAALSLFGMIRDWEATALLTLEEEPTPRGEVASEAMKFEADSLIVLYFLRKQKERERFVEVIKMRGTKHSNKIYPFEITNHGISVSSNFVSRFF